MNDKKRAKIIKDLHSRYREDKKSFNSYAIRILRAEFRKDDDARQKYEPKKVIVDGVEYESINKAMRGSGRTKGYIKRRNP